MSLYTCKQFVKHLCVAPLMCASLRLDVNLANQQKRISSSNL